MGIKLKPYPEYKESGVPWLGRIPAQWTVKRAKYFYREVDERSASGKEELLSVSHITGVTPRSQKNVSMFMAESTVGYKLCRNDDLVINTMWAWMAALGISRQIGLVSPAYAVYRPFLPSPLRAEYVDHVLRLPCYATEYLIRSTGITASRLRMYPDQFLRIPILCPPDNDQEAVIGFLVKIGQRLARLIRLKRRMIDLLTEQKQAIIHRAVTRGINPNVRLQPSGIDWLGAVPAHWRANYLKHSALLQTGTTLGKSYADSALIERPYVRVANVQNGFISTVNMASIRLPEAEALRCELREGDVLMTEGGDIDKLGRGAVWHGEIPDCLHQNHVFAVRCKLSILLPDYLVALMMSNYGRTYFQITAKQTTNLASTNSSTIKSFPIVIPEVSEQRGILAHIANKTASIDAAISKTTKDIDLLREYRTRLIADVVTGKLDVRGVALPDLTEAPAAWDDGDPTEEPPEEESAPED